MKYDSEYNEYLSRLGKRVKCVREESGLTQEQMSEGENGIEYKYYQRIEQGKNITIKTLYRISKKLGVRMKDILDD